MAPSLRNGSASAGSASSSTEQKTTQNGNSIKCNRPVSSSKESSVSSIPSLLARYTCASILLGIIAIWAKLTFVPEHELLSVHVPMHSYHTPLALTLGYLISLPLLKYAVEKFVLANRTGMSEYMKHLLKESMVLYNIAQVILNGWMVYRFIHGLIWKGHPFVGDLFTSDTGNSYAIWVHYCDKYLEFLDTYFMVLRGNFHQVSFLHVYHHTTIAWAWWIGIKLFPGGDAYFGALLNSWIHVMMYSYYALSLLKISCPWKRYLTQAQLAQFASVVIYSFFSAICWPVEERRMKHYIAILVQIGEMVSLFVLFSQFYRKSYSQKNKKVKNDDETADTMSSAPAVNYSGKPSSPSTHTEDDDDQCQAAVKALTTTTNELIGSAAKDASKIVTTAKKTLSKRTQPVQKEGWDAVSRPSWSIVN